MPAPLALLAALIARRRVAWIAAAVPVVLWAALFGWRFLPPALRGASGTVEAAGPELRVLAFNLLTYNRNVEGIIDVIEEAQPDLIAFAELNSVVNNALSERLAAEYPYRTYHRLTGAGFGNAIYSRWPLEVFGSLQTGRGLRSAAADVYTPDGVVRFVAMHPWSTHIGDTWDEFKEGVIQSFAAREAQVGAVCRYLDAWGDIPVILAGDFNMGEFSDAYRCINRRLHDGYRAAGQGYGATWPSTQLREWPWSLFGSLPLLARIDYVFHSDHWRAVEARVLDSGAGSDHRPVLVVLRPT
jgi:vancomycin resistance protein VanJ